jgi:hypothetical protein
VPSGGLRSVAGVLASDEVARFERLGYTVVRGAVPADVMAACQAEVAAGLRAAGVDPDDPATWSAPVVRLACPESPAFAAAGTQPALWSVYDQLLGSGAWWRRPGVGGTIPVRFPHEEDPGDAGWHIDGSYEVDGDYWVNVASRGRGLLALFLLSDIGDEDAPTELKVGSHLDVPALLAPFGDAGTHFATVSEQLPASAYARPSAFATGEAGDVYVCHPFLVHRATWPHRGRHARAVAQPGVAIHQPFRLDTRHQCPVEAAILAGLHRP